MRIHRHVGEHARACNRSPVAHTQSRSRINPRRGYQCWRTGNLTDARPRKSRMRGKKESKKGTKYSDRGRKDRERGERGPGSNGKEFLHASRLRLTKTYPDTKLPRSSSPARNEGDSRLFLPGVPTRFEDPNDAIPHYYLPIVNANGGGGAVRSVGFRERTFSEINHVIRR